MWPLTGLDLACDSRGPLRLAEPSSQTPVTIAPMSISAAPTNGSAYVPRNGSGDRSASGALRMVQTVAAYRRATLLNRDSLDAHWGLFQAYSRMGFDDLATKHFGEVVRCLRTLPVRPGEEEQNEENIKKAEEDLKKLEETLTKHTNDYEAKSLLQRPGKKAQTALEAGLVQKALDVLLAAGSKDDVDVDVARLEVELLARTGMMEELRVQIAPGNDEEALRQLFEPGDYEWYRALLSAALGDYAEADDFMGQASERRRGREDSGKDAGQSAGSGPCGQTGTRPARGFRRAGRRIADEIHSRSRCSQPAAST